MALFQNANALDAAHAGQADVTQDDVGRIRRDTAEGLLHRPITARALVAWRAVDQHRQAFANVALIFDDRRSDHPRFGHPVSPYSLPYVSTPRTTHTGGGVTVRVTPG